MNDPTTTDLDDPLRPGARVVLTNAARQTGWFDDYAHLTGTINRIHADPVVVEVLWDGEGRSWHPWNSGQCPHLRRAGADRDLAVSEPPSAADPIYEVGDAITVAVGRCAGIHGVIREMDTLGRARIGSTGDQWHLLVDLVPFESPKLGGDHLIALGRRVQVASGQYRDNGKIGIIVQTNYHHESCRVLGIGWMDNAALRAAPGPRYPIRRPRCTTASATSSR